MHDVRTRKPGRQPAGARKQPKHKRGNKPAQAGAGPPGQSPPTATAPFMLAARPPAFPLDVRVPPHRGAVIAPASHSLVPILARPEFLAPEPGAAEYLVTPARAPLKRKKAAAPTGKAPAKRTKQAGATTTGIPTARKGKSAGPHPVKAKRANFAQTSRASPAQPARQIEATRAQTAPHSPAKAAWPHIPDQADPAGTATATAASDPQSNAPISANAEHDRPIALVPAEITPAATSGPPVIGAIPLAERIALPPLLHGRALVRQSTGPVARIVAWLTRLLPRKRKSALPRARTRLDQSPHRPAALEPTPAAPAEATETTAELARRMLLQLSAENERLRRELEVLRGAMGPTAEG